MLCFACLATAACPDYFTSAAVLQNGVNCGNAADFWHRYEEDIQRAAELHSTTFRLSLEWSRIEPSHGSIDSHGIARYHQILDCIHKCVSLPGSPCHVSPCRPMYETAMPTCCRLHTC